MSNIAIKVENLSKAYRIGQKESRADTLGGALASWVRAPFQNFKKLRNLSQINANSNDTDIFWALRDINFEVKHGEVLGIIGKNGAGKSTLLKILSQITEPTTGHIDIHGRVASLLEVGTGFNPELTGRENIYLNGTILGMTRREIDRKFDEIVDFSGVEKFIDTPVKRYSSGMKVRLAFAVAANLDPEILIIDEVLAVGDAEFQKKCLGKMQDLSGKEGRTVLFVSHDMSAVQRLCSKSFLLQNGIILIQDTTEKVISFYLDPNHNIISFVPEDSLIGLLKVEIINPQFKIVKSIDVQSRVGINIFYRINNDQKTSYTLGINIYDESGSHLFTSHDVEFARKNISFKRGDYSCVVWIPENLLAEGVFRVSVAGMSYNPYIVHFHVLDATSFFIVDMLDGTSARGNYSGKMPGQIRPLLKWEHQIN